MALLIGSAGVSFGLYLVWLGVVRGLVQRKLPFHGGGYNYGLGAQIEGVGLAAFGLGAIVVGTLAICGGLRIFLR